MDPTLVTLGVALTILLVPIIWVIAVYNRFVTLRQHVRESWHGIDIELKRRYDLIPNLVQTVRGYAAHERQTLERVIELRNRAAANTGSPAEHAVDEQALSLGLKQLFALAEAYPTLKADTTYLALQRELANTEDRIAASRRFFNANVRDLNRLCQSFPTNIVGTLFGFRPETFFQISEEAERVVPRVALP
jgi:LemA protein